VPARFYLDRSWWGVRAARLVPTRANNQPAFGYYLQDPLAPIAHAHGLIVLTLEGDQISRCLKRLYFRSAHRIRCRLSLRVPYGTRHLLTNGKGTAIMP
jgi:hypothetical protein